MCVWYGRMCVPVYIHTCVHVYPHIYIHLYAYMYLCIYIDICIHIIWAFLVAQLEESTSNTGDSSSIPGLRRFPGERIGYTLQYSWASLVAWMVKNLPAMQENWIQSIGWENPLEEGMTTHSSILEWRIPADRGAWQATVHGVTNS